ncbi:MAG: LysE family translocator [Betaproteobacteria bacterium]
MFGTHDLALFVVSGLLLNITPGVDFIFVAGRSAAQGFRAGIWAAFGIGAGCVVHVVAAALGLSAILATSATAFTVIKWIGAAYLVYIGLSMLFAKAAAPEAKAVEASSPVATQRTAHASIFWQGLLTNVLNPKVALFFLAFVPQFIDAGSTSKVSAFLFLGLVFNVNGTLWNIFVAWSASRLARPINDSTSTSKARGFLWLNRVLGGFFIALGAKLALADRA